MNTLFQPETNGQKKVVNKFLEGDQRNIVNDQQTQSVKWIYLEEWWYNSTYYPSTKRSFSEALYGYPPPTTREYVINNFKVTTTRDYLATSDC